MIDITAEIRAWCAKAQITNGLLTLLSQHTSASLTIQENASPEVQQDLHAAFGAIAPRDAQYAHSLEGPDDMPAHIKTVVSGVHLAIPMIDGALALGVWQGVYLWEHRDAPHQRHVAAHIIGD